MGKTTLTNILRKQIVDYLLQNPIDRGTSDCYSKVAVKFGVQSENVRRIYRTLRKNGQVEIGYPGGDTETPDEDKQTFEEDVKGGTGNVVVITKKQISSLQELIEFCKIDTNEWNIDRWLCNKWCVGAKNNQNKIEVTPLFQVKAWLSRRKVDTDLVKQKEAVMAELKAYVPNYEVTNILDKYTSLVEEFDSSKKDCILEINIPDLHIGKMGWAPESGEHYDFKIAVKRYKEAVASLISRTPIATIEKILLVVGHDFLNSDGKSNLTTAGTPQHNDVRFYKMLQVGKSLLVETIDELSILAKVDVMVVSGNHDTNSMLMMGDILDAWYHSSDRVSIFNDAAPRKYYQYGVTGLMFAHGHNERLNDMGILFATENPKLWADTKFHRVHVGHFHHSKQIKIKDVDEQIGCIVKIINSLSSNDAWHTEKGYMSLKGAEAFLYHKKQGILANYFYYV